jgi:hypothetical protein
MIHPRLCAETTRTKRVTATLLHYTVDRGASHATSDCKVEQDGNSS